MGLNDNSKGTILLLCSESDVLAVMRKILESADYIVMPARDIASAVAEMRDIAPDLLIVRPYIDCISGHDAALYLRTKCDGMRVLMATGLPDDEGLLCRESVRCIEVFPKPFSAEEFLAKVAAVLAPTRAVAS